MRLFHTLTIAALLSAAPFAASAADLLAVPVSTDAVVPVAEESWRTQNTHRASKTQAPFNTGKVQDKQ